MVLPLYTKGPKLALMHQSSITVLAFVSALNPVAAPCWNLGFRGLWAPRRARLHKAGGGPCVRVHRHRLPQNRGTEPASDLHGCGQPPRLRSLPRVPQRGGSEIPSHRPAHSRVPQQGGHSAVSHPRDHHDAASHCLRRLHQVQPCDGAGCGCAHSQAPAAGERPRGHAPSSRQLARPTPGSRLARASQ